MALTDKQMRELIKKVRECAPNMSSNDITLILEYFNYNVDQSVASILESGFNQNLQHEMFSDQNINTFYIDEINTAELFSIVNSFKPNKSTSDDDGGQEALKQWHQATPKTSVSPVELNGHVNGVVEDEDEEEEEELVKKQQKMKDAQRHKEERDRTMSEISVASTTERSKNPHAGLEKSCKELQRQTTSLQHLKVVLKEQMDKSYKRVNEVFKELRQQMVEREAELMFLLDKSKAKASEVLATYELKAADLKLRTDRAQAMNDKEVAILRSDIKHFVTDHKHYEEVATNPKFTCDFNKMLSNLCNSLGRFLPSEASQSTRLTCPPTASTAVHPRMIQLPTLLLPILLTMG
ncbi:hypothetical protein HELRODRAFT_194102 [Helobdella robusta]|uniref:CUE domain-containing protein n=1 Tax=Helobdella robusta TaxID=6412 RepID=T1FVP0_HELRO|nr:hypothetical protein HELRODRAFT_194102 [Helobdella robusta]ESN93456.1 hypothetical protein HELRODRAFT_194102 [Helobdella robusta]